MPNVIQYESFRDFVEGRNATMVYVPEPMHTVELDGCLELEAETPDHGESYWDWIARI